MDPLVVAIIAYLVALVLFAIDVFIPTGAILIFCSAVMAMISVYFGFRSGTNAGLTMLLIVFATIPVLVWTFVKVWPNTPIGRRVLLSPQQATPAQDKDELREMIGHVVLNRWPLIPMGQIQIGHRRFNARSADGKTIDTKVRVKVIEVSERILVVSPTLEPLTDSNTRSSKAAVSTTGDVNPAQQQSPESLLETPAKSLGLDSLTELPLDREN